MFTVLGYEVSVYGILSFIGFIIGIIISLKNCKYYSIKKEDIIYCSVYAIIGVFIGAKLLYLLTSLPYIISNEINIAQLFKGGFVFYGGAIGGVIGIWIYAKQFKMKFSYLLNIGIVVIPLIHAIGRMGCFFNGCCYGIEYNGIGHIMYINSLIAPNNINLFPVQLIESILNIVIFVILLSNFKKNLHSYKNIALYCILYGIGRFILEFFRGDEIRGLLFGISTSQYISIIVIVIGIILYKKRINENI